MPDLEEESAAICMSALRLSLATLACGVGHMNLRRPISMGVSFFHDGL